MTPTPKPKSLNEWLQGFLTPQVLILAVTGLVCWGVRVELHEANTDIHHSTTCLQKDYVQTAVHGPVDSEREKRIDGKLADIKEGMAEIKALLREGHK